MRKLNKTIPPPSSILSIIKHSISPTKLFYHNSVVRGSDVMVEGVDGEKVWVCRKLCRQVDRVYLVEGVWEALTFKFPNDTVKNSNYDVRRISPLTSHTRISEIKKLEGSKVSVKKIVKKITLEDVPAKFRYRFKVKGQQVLCGAGGWWLLENGLKGRAKDLEVDYDEGLFGELGLEGKEVKFESPTKSKKVEKIIASPPSTGRVRQSEEYWWTCKSCTLSNNYWRIKCSLCSSPRSLKTCKMSRLLKLAIKHKDDRETATRKGVDWRVCCEMWECGVKGCMRKVLGRQGEERKWCQVHRPRFQEKKTILEVTYLKKINCLPPRESKRYVDERLSSTFAVTLGSRVRKFFKGYGYFDGTVSSLLRCYVDGDALEIVYRITYEDGDCEDMSWRVISSLRRFYDTRGTRECEEMSKQVGGPDREIEVKGKKGRIVGTIPEWNSVVIRWGISGCEVVNLLDIQECIDEVFTEQKEEGVVGEEVAKHLDDFRDRAWSFPGSFIGSTLLNSPDMREIADRTLSSLKKKKFKLVDDTGKDLPEEEAQCYILEKFRAAAGYKAKGQVFDEKRAALLEWPPTEMKVSSQLKGCGVMTFTAARDASYLISKKVIMEGKSVDFVGDAEFEDSSDEEDDEEENNNGDGEAIEECLCVGGHLKRKVESLDSDVKRPKNVFNRALPPVHDPAAVLPYLRADPHIGMVCQICDTAGDDDKILLCDKCDKGFHMYCLRPVMVNIPVGEWLCDSCRPNLTANALKYEASRLTMMRSHKQAQVSSFLKFPFKNPVDFWCKEIAEYAAVVYKTKGNFSLKEVNGMFTKENNFFQVGPISQSFKESTSNHWLLPSPPSSVELYVQAVTSVASALMFMNVERYSDNLIYSERAPREMNRSELDTVEEMSPRNLLIYKQFKRNTALGLIPPVKVEYDKAQGFVVEALEDIKDKTLLVEYAGAVTRIVDSGQTDSDSLMVLLETNSPKTSLIIDPSKSGNMARFLSGVNNSDHESKKKINVRTRRFSVNGECHVVLFACRRIKKGERLSYDYNAGIAKMSDEEWKKHGFYDTSHFS
ncbi:hypothetical protein TrST_g12893 [Triparma strigata]|uniref:Uncharacterized protein n=1 Tax=Triparma strigata TaxID=1606541 RepID=A0A9W7A3N6_9STRA|nr:hypothetical protein TrST_g12893 [Triparma strigata]